MWKYSIIKVYVDTPNVENEKYGQFHFKTFIYLII